MGFPNLGTCAPWAERADFCGPCGEDAPSPPDDDVLETMIQVASDILYLRTAARFSGVCETTVRPCRRNAMVEIRYPSWWQWNQSWGWCGCHRHPERGDCGCTNLSELTLGAYPIVDVTEILIDGQLVPEDAYRIDDDRWLVRIDGKSFPCCQDLTADPTTDANTFQVRLLYGTPPPPAGRVAAASLACQLALACNGSDRCQLPRRVQQVVRQGTSIATILDTAALKDGLFGIPEVDFFVATYNPNRIGRRAAIFSPDITSPVRRVSDPGGS